MKLILTAKLISTNKKKEAYIEKKEINRIDFTPNIKDWHNGFYGFDSYETAKKGCCDKKSLEDVYEQYQDIANKKYYIPWVCAPKGEMFQLNLKMKGNGKTIEIYDDDIIFSPNILSKSINQVKVVCNSYLKENKKIELFIDDKVVGAINFYPNIVKQTMIRVCYVGTDLEKLLILKNRYKLSLIEKWLHSAFHQMLIEIHCEEDSVILSDEAIIFLNNKGVFVENRIVRRNDHSRNALMQYLKNELTIRKKRVQKNEEILLFITDFQCFVDEGYKTVYNNGISSSQEGVSLMFLGNSMFSNDSKCTPEEEIPHEIMHCLGLKHIFSKESKILYNQGGTNNYMDYNNSKKITYKWQWDIMRKSNFAK